MFCHNLTHFFQRIYSQLKWAVLLTFEQMLFSEPECHSERIWKSRCCIHIGIVMAVVQTTTDFSRENWQSNHTLNWLNGPFQRHRISSFQSHRIRTCERHRSIYIYKPRLIIAGCDVNILPNCRLTRKLTVHIKHLTEQHKLIVFQGRLSLSIIPFAY